MQESRKPGTPPAFLDSCIPYFFRRVGLSHALPQWLISGALPRRGYTLDYSLLRPNGAKSPN